MIFSPDYTTLIIIAAIIVAAVTYGVGYLKGSTHGYEAGQIHALEGHFDMVLIEFEDGGRRYVAKKYLEYLDNYTIIK